MALLSYKNEQAIDIHRNGVHWLSESVTRWAGLRYLARTKLLIERTQPDWIVGFSDTYYGILAEHFARKLGSRSLIDAYDNYEAYLHWCKPLHRIWRRAIRRATAISVAGPALADIMTPERRAGNVLVASMAVDSSAFVPLSSDYCRRQLDLPSTAPLIGYSGALYPNRGLDVLFYALAVLRKSVPEARLVLSGRLHRSVRLPKDAIWLGYLADEHMPTLINSMDVLAIVNQPSAFGNYSHPIKLYEAMSCQKPVVASRTPATEWILASHPHLLAEAADPNALADRLLYALTQKRIDYGPQPTWEDIADRLERFLASAGRSPYF